MKFVKSKHVTIEKGQSKPEMLTPEDPTRQEFRGQRGFSEIGRVSVILPSERCSSFQQAFT